MKDKKGLYYFPNPANPRFRAYVKEEGGEVMFRLYNVDDPKLWEEHGWVPYDVIRQAASLYRSGDFDPAKVYDIEVARALIGEDRE